jgi:hypothetical protein
MEVPVELEYSKNIMMQENGVNIYEVYCALVVAVDSMYGMQYGSVAVVS